MGEDQELRHARLGDRRLGVGCNREEFGRWLDKEHPIRWAWDTYAGCKARYRAMMADPALAHLERIRITRPWEAPRLIERLAGGG